MVTKKTLYAEFMGTFALLFAGTGAIAAGKADLLGVALAHGIAIAVAVSAFAGISGAHFNPAVSFAFLVTKRISINEFVQYVVAQLAGAVVATWVIKEALGDTAVTDFSANTTSTHAFLLEAVATALLVSTIWGVAVDKRGTFGAVAGLPIGLIISAGILAIGPVTGAALNPARWFGPALISGTTWNVAWLYILAPMTGAAIAALAYEYFAQAKK